VGGGEDGHALLSAYVSGLETGTTSNFHSLLVCGPEMSAQHRQEITRRASSLARVTVMEFCNDMTGMMDAADLVVCMGGYNTTCELLSLRKRAVMVPRTRPVLEQWLRAERLRRLGVFRALHPDQLTPAALMRAVEEELDRKNVHPSVLYQVDLEGLPRIAQAVRGLLTDAQALPRYAHQTLGS
jgi:predicted glycosyltransferase